MATYRMNDGVVVDTALAQQHWDEDTRWDGRNQISVATGSQWEHEQLYRSRKGRYYIKSWSQRQGSLPSADWASPEEAVVWLLVNAHEIPAELAAAAAEVVE